jgi:hypothetical protein
VRALHTVVAFFLLVAAAGACHRDRCVPICEQRAKELGCHPTDPCKTTCEKLHTAPTCKKELKAFEDCFTARPLAEWECDLGDGTPVVHPSVCPSERHAVMTCLESHPPGPPGR